MPDEEPQPQETGQPEATEQSSSEGEPLGDAGKKALEQERAARKAAEKASRKAEAELADLRKQSMSEQERAVVEAREQARTEALAEANRRIINAEVKAAAAGKLANPKLGTRLLDLDQFKVDDEGNVDVEAISAAIDGLLEAEPYLAAGATPRTPGSADGGPRGAPKTVTDMDALLRAAVQGRK